MRKVYLLPNLFTAGSLFCGMLAIYHVFNQELVYACWLILLSAVFDVADGAIARITRTNSAFGLNFDSLSDLVAFGVAPAMLAYEMLNADFPGLAKAVCSLYVVFGALRLARFNVQAAREERKGFLGMPIPAAGLVIVSLIWVFQLRLPMIESRRMAAICASTLVLVAYLMVSKVPYYGLKSINLRNRQPFEIFVTLMVIVCLLYVLKQFLDVVLLVIMGFYLLASPGLWLMQMRSQRRRARRPAGPETAPPVTSPIGRPDGE